MELSITRKIEKADSQQILAAPVFQSVRGLRTAWKGCATRQNNLWVMKSPPGESKNKRIGKRANRPGRGGGPWAATPAAAFSFAPLRGIW